MNASRSTLFVALVAVVVISLLAYTFILSDAGTNHYRRIVDTELKNGSEFFPSKNVLVRAVYYDGRPRDGHQDAVVFLVIAWKKITDNK